MKATTINRIRVLAAIAIGVVLIAGASSSAWANPAGSEEMRQNWAKHRQQWVQARLAKVAERLEIKTSQQDAW